MDKVIYTFNQYFFDLLSTVKNLDFKIKTVLKKHYKIKDMLTREHIDEFCKQFFNDTATMLYQDNPETDVNLCIFKHVGLGMLSQSGIDPHILKSFVYLLCIMAHIYKTTDPEDEASIDTLYEHIMKLIEKIEAENNDSYKEDLNLVLDDDVRSLLQSYCDVKQAAAAASNNNTSTPTAPAPAATAAAEPSSSDASFTDSIMDSIKNTKMGSLAKEITSEIDLSCLGSAGADADGNFDLNNLTSNSGVMTNIISQVGSKIQEKMKSGEINQEELVSEAFSMLNMLGGSSGMMNNPLCKHLMKMAGGAGGGGVKINEPKVRSMATRERLRKKLESKNLI